MFRPRQRGAAKTAEVACLLGGCFLVVPATYAGVSQTAGASRTVRHELMCLFGTRADCSDERGRRALAGRLAGPLDSARPVAVAGDPFAGAAMGTPGDAVMVAHATAPVPETPATATDLRVVGGTRYEVIPLGDTAPPMTAQHFEDAVRAFEDAKVFLAEMGFEDVFAQLEGDVVFTSEYNGKYTSDCYDVAYANFHPGLPGIGDYTIWQRYGVSESCVRRHAVHELAHIAQLFAAWESTGRKAHLNTGAPGVRMITEGQARYIEWLFEPSAIPFEAPLLVGRLPLVVNEVESPSHYDSAPFFDYLITRHDLDLRQFWEDLDPTHITNSADVLRALSEVIPGGIPYLPYVRALHSARTPENFRFAHQIPEPHFPKKPAPFETQGTFQPHQSGVYDVMIPERRDGQPEQIVSITLEGPPQVELWVDHPDHEEPIKLRPDSEAPHRIPPAPGQTLRFYVANLAMDESSEVRLKVEAVVPAAEH